MSKFSKENLYLLEFLVDKVNLEFCAAQMLRCVPGETCVSFQFLNNPPIPICERDFVPKMRNYMEGCSGCGNIKNGKSCLFSLTQQQIAELEKKFDINVEVFKKLKEDDPQDKMNVGQSVIPLHQMFQELMYTANAQDSASTKTIKDCYKIMNSQNDLVGHLSCYMRISCFGKSIVNQFQMNMKDNSVDFKADQGHYLFKYNKKNISDPVKKSCPPSGHVDSNRGGGGQYPSGSQPTPPCGSPAVCGPDDPCGGGGQPQVSCCQNVKTEAPGCPCMVRDEGVQSEPAGKEKKGGKKGGKKGKKKK